MTTTVFVRQPRKALAMLPRASVDIAVFDGPPPVKPRRGFFGLFSNKREQAADKQRADAYFGYLDGCSAELQRYRTEQQTLLTAYQPPIEGLAVLARTRNERLWERRPADRDFLQVRLGLGTFPSSVSVRLPQADPATPYLDRAQALAREYANVPDVPNVLPLARIGALAIAGEPDAGAAVARALLAQIAAFHSPDDVQIYAICPPARAALWFWLGWLPHARMRATRPADDDRVLLACQPRDVATALTELQFIMEQRERAMPQTPLPRIVVLFDDYAQMRNHPTYTRIVAQGRDLGLYAVCIGTDSAPGCGALLSVSSASARLDYPPSPTAPPPLVVRPDMPPPETCTTFARSLAPLIPDTAPPVAAESPFLLDLLRLDRADLDPARLWRTPADLTLPIGVTEGQPMTLSLATHGIIAGAPGTGKSDLLQTVIAGLALKNGPERLTFMLVDGGGSGAPFAGVRHLPHVTEIVTDGGAVFAQSLAAEMQRRTTLLAEAGVATIADYVQHPARPLLPYLLIALDEAASLPPETITILVTIARKSGKHGMFLLFSSRQARRLLESPLLPLVQYRICLRVETPDVSRAILGLPDAAAIPPEARGFGYVRASGILSAPFQAARVTASADFGPIRIMDTAWQPAQSMAMHAQDATTDIDLIVAACNAARTAQATR